MPLYIRDDKVDALAGRLADLRKMTKTEAVRLALEHELERQNAMPSLVEIGLAFARDLRKRANPTEARPADKAFIDSLYEEG